MAEDKFAPLEEVVRATAHLTDPLHLGGLIHQYVIPVELAEIRHREDHHKLVPVYVAGIVTEEGERKLVYGNFRDMHLHPAHPTYSQEVNLGKIVHYHTVLKLES